MKYDLIIAALLSALGQIQIVNGYNTDAGLKVWRQHEYMTEDPEKPCIILFPGEVTDSLDGDPAPSQGEENHLLPFKIEAFIADDAAGAQGSKLRQDIVKALKVDQYLGGLSEGYDGSVTSNSTVERAGNNGFLGFVEINATLLYVTLFGEI